jgi:small subunit ribosomal protein S20
MQKSQMAEKKCRHGQGRIIFCIFLAFFLTCCVETVDFSPRASGNVFLESLHHCHFFTMAHTKSAQKRIRQTEVRTERNRAAKSRIRTLRKKVADAVTSGDKAAASTAVSALASAVDKAAKTNLIHSNKAANIKSKAAKALAAAGA